MKKLFTILLLLSVSLLASAQDTLHITADGDKLRQYYLSLDVEHFWLAGRHIDWETGIHNRNKATSGISTHCSAFAAAATSKLNIYLLRPPQHGQLLLANAQFKWLRSAEGAAVGWKPLGAGIDAYGQGQQMANKGFVVVAVCKNPHSDEPGHIALIMPCTIATADIAINGPDLIMAGKRNFNDINLRNGFKSHITTWPEPGILLYYYDKKPSL